MADEYDDAIGDLRRRSGGMAQLVGPILEIVGVTGASVCTMGFLAPETLAASDRTAARLDEAQFDLGEGPCWDAVASGAPVLERDLRHAEAWQWPALAEALRNEPIRAVYAFPVSIGMLRIGAIDFYHAEPQDLGRAEVRRAAAVAEALGPHVLRNALERLREEEPPGDPGPFSRRLVHQATGYVVGQLGVSAEDAELLIQGRAFASGRSMHDVAVSILSGEQRFSAAGNVIKDEQ